MSLRRWLSGILVKIERVTQLICLRYFRHGRRGKGGLLLRIESLWLLPLSLLVTYPLVVLMFLRTIRLLPLRLCRPRIHLMVGLFDQGPHSLEVLLSQVRSHLHLHFFSFLGFATRQTLLTAILHIFLDRITTNTII